MTTPETAPVEVTQADRDLFKLIITGMVGPTKHNAIDGGGFDSDDRMLAIARHRATNETARQDGLREALRPSFQSEVADWMLTCFGEEIAADKIERADRFIEEALELSQTVPGFTVERARALVEYVFARPVGEMGQEVGGVGVTLAALCNTHGINISDEWERELARVWTKVDVIRAKQAAKPVGSALPAALSDISPLANEAPVAWLYDGPDSEHYIREHRDVGHAALVRAGWTETPLYARPNDTGALRDCPPAHQPGDVERVARALWVHENDAHVADAGAVWDDPTQVVHSLYWTQKMADNHPAYREKALIAITALSPDDGEGK